MHLHRDQQANSENLPQADPSSYPQADPSQANAAQTPLDPTPRSTQADATDEMGEPVKPLHDPPTRGTQAAADPPSYTDSVNDPSSQTQRQTQNTPSTASYTLGPSDGNFPTAQPPRSLSIPSGQQQEALKTPNGQSQSANPYVQTSSASTDSSPSKSPMDSIMQVFNKWGKKAEGVTGNVWTHLMTGPNVADTAMGRIALGAKAMSEGGLENVYRHTFDVGPDEHLLKTYACYLSTSTGPVAGTLYISSHQLAFCSDRPIAMPASSPKADPNNKTSTQPESTEASTTSPTSNKSQQCYYKVVVPISQVESVNPSENTQKKQPEKYVEVRTTDGHEFWFMGFVNYDKGVKNLQETVRNKENATGTIDANQLNRDTTPATTDGKQMDRDTTPDTTDGKQMDRDTTSATTDGKMDRDTTFATTNGKEMDRDSTSATTNGKMDRDTTSATTDRKQMDREAIPATTAPDSNELDREVNPATADTNQMNRDTTQDTTDASRVPA